MQKMHTEAIMSLIIANIDSLYFVNKNIMKISLLIPVHLEM